MYNKSFCRLCLSEEGIMEEIFLNTDPEMPKKISDCVQFQIKNVPGLPSRICEICKSELIICQRFRRHCIKSNDILKEIYPDLMKDELDSLVMVKETNHFERDVFEEGCVVNNEIEKQSNVNVEIEYENEDEGLPPDRNEIDCGGSKNIDEETIDYVELINIVDSETDSDAGLGCEIVNVEYQMDLKKNVAYSSDYENIQGETSVEDDNSQSRDEIYSNGLPSIDEDDNYMINYKNHAGSEEETITKNNSKDTIKSSVEDSKFEWNIETAQVVKVRNGNKIRYHTVCPICKKMQQNIKQHMMVHTDEKPLKCPHCGRGFRQKSNLKHHINIHTGKKPYGCTLCEKAFPDPASLRSHMVAHTGERKYRCDICGKAFGHSHTLAAHRRIHTQERRHGCPICEKRFLSTHALKKHVRVHTGERPYKCSICSKEFSTSGNLTTHIRVHTKERPFTCYICYLQFGYRSVLTMHMKTHNCVLYEHNGKTSNTKKKN